MVAERDGGRKGTQLISESMSCVPLFSRPYQVSIEITITSNVSGTSAGGITFRPPLGTGVSVLYPPGLTPTTSSIYLPSGSFQQTYPFVITMPILSNQVGNVMVVVPTLSYPSTLTQAQNTTGLTIEMLLTNIQMNPR